MPQLSRFERLDVVAFKEGNFSRTLRQARVTGAPRQFQIFGERDCGGTTLAGNFGRKQFIQERRRQLDAWQRRLSRSAIGFAKCAAPRPTLRTTGLRYAGSGTGRGLSVRLRRCP